MVGVALDSTGWIYGNTLARLQKDVHWPLKPSINGICKFFNGHVWTQRLRYRFRSSRMLTLCNDGKEIHLKLCLMALNTICWRVSQIVSDVWILNGIDSFGPNCTCTRDYKSYIVKRGASVIVLPPFAAVFAHLTHNCGASVAGDGKRAIIRQTNENPWIVFTSVRHEFPPFVTPI